MVEAKIGYKALKKGQVVCRLMVGVISGRSRKVANRLIGGSNAQVDQGIEKGKVAY